MDIDSKFIMEDLRNQLNRLSQEKAVQYAIAKQLQQENESLKKKLEELEQQLIKAE